MSEYNTSFELNPDRLIALITKVEKLIANEPVVLAMSALLSAALRLETCQHYGNERKAAKLLERWFKDIAAEGDN